MRQSGRVIAAILCGPVLAFAAQAQNPMSAPTYGEISLSAGFTPDPYLVNLSAGGQVDAAAELGAQCLGFIAQAPDFDLYYNAGSLPLIISAMAEADTTLVIHGPDGQWHCDDDSGGGVNPRLRFAAPVSGLYGIWVGTYTPGHTEPAQLRVSELDR
ncbi:MAG: peptidase S1 [Alphaproteobacteria bacterium]|nr:peptidase S1 [Alphaproteobacteria bacterium]